MPDDILHESIIERMVPGKSQWQKRYGILTMTAILLFKGDHALHLAPSETIPCIELRAKNSNVKGTPQNANAKINFGKAMMKLVDAKVLMDAAANRDESVEDDPDVGSNLPKAKREVGKQEFQIETIKATIECRALTLKDRDTWAKHLL
jgi:hypothetical protein